MRGCSLLFSSTSVKHIPSRTYLATPENKVRVHRLIRQNDRALAPAIRLLKRLLRDQLRNEHDIPVLVDTSGDRRFFLVASFDSDPPDKVRAVLWVTRSRNSRLFFVSYIAVEPSPCKELEPGLINGAEFTFNIFTDTFVKKAIRFFANQLEEVVFDLALDEPKRAMAKARLFDHLARLLGMELWLVDDRIDYVDPIRSRECGRPVKHRLVYGVRTNFQASTMSSNGSMSTKTACGLLEFLYGYLFSDITVSTLAGDRLMDTGELLERAKKSLPKTIGVKPCHNLRLIQRRH
jgi:hypothetical protein